MSTKEKFDAIVVGAGPSGNAAAYTLAKAGLKVLQIERGEYPGSKNVQGAILYSNALEQIIPDWSVQNDRRPVLLCWTGSATQTHETTLVGD